MENRASDIYSVAMQPRPDRQERPLPPYPGSSQHSSPQVGSRDTALYERLVTGAPGAVNDSSREYERWRDSGYQGTPRSYTRDTNASPSASTLLPGQESRSRGASESQRIGEKRSQANEAVNDLRATRPFRHDAPSTPRRTSSISTRGSTHSIMAQQSDESSSGGDRPLLAHPPSQNRRRRVSERTEVVVPKWQADAEVTFCPICRTQFSFFVRKHHCRKCGRVVCNSCSPHRITIPYQYIVQPPVDGMGNCNSTNSTDGNARPVIDAARAGSSREVTSLGGGERVRLCNPCVPDPNIAPPQTALNDSPQLYSSPNRQGRSASTTSHSQRQQSISGTPRNLETFHEALRRTSRESSYPANIQYGSYRDPPHISRPQEQWEARSRSSTHSGTSRDPASMGAQLSTPIASQRQGSGSQTAPSNSASLPRLVNPGPQPAPSPLPQLQPPRDECWICHRLLPAADLHNSDDLRTKHVAQCIARAETAGGSPATAGNGTSAPKRSNLLAYKSTEKDCVDAAECTICLEDYEVGEDMARLECFCRFHLSCIKGWWERKHGQCPVHQPNEY